MGNYGAKEENPNTGGKEVYEEYGENRVFPIMGDNQLEVFVLKTPRKTYILLKYKYEYDDVLFILGSSNLSVEFTTNAFMGTDMTFFRYEQEVATSSQQIGENSWAFGSDIIGYVKALKFSKKNLMELSLIRILLNLLGNISEGDALHCILRRGKEYKSLMVVLEKDSRENVLMRYFVNNIYKYLDIV